MHYYSPLFLAPARMEYQPTRRHKQTIPKGGNGTGFEMLGCYHFCCSCCGCFYPPRDVQSQTRKNGEKIQLSCTWNGKEYNANTGWRLPAWSVCHALDVVGWRNEKWTLPSDGDAGVKRKISFLRSDGKDRGTPLQKLTLLLGSARSILLFGEWNFFLWCWFRWNSDTQNIGRCELGTLRCKEKVATINVMRTCPLWDWRRFLWKVVLEVTFSFTACL